MARTRARLVLVAVVSAWGALAVVAACSPSASSSGSSEACPGVDGSPAIVNECPDPASPPSWENEVEPLIVTYCWQCHGEGGIEQSVYDYSTYKGVYAQRGEIGVFVGNCTMPPLDASPPAIMPDPSQRQTIVSWVNCGAPGDN